MLVWFPEFIKLILVNRIYQSKDDKFICPFELLHGLFSRFFLEVKIYRKRTPAKTNGSFESKFLNTVDRNDTTITSQ